MSFIPMIARGLFEKKRMMSLHVLHTLRILDNVLFHVPDVNNSEHVPTGLRERVKQISALMQRFCDPKGEGLGIKAFYRTEWGHEALVGLMAETVLAKYWPADALPQSPPTASA